MTPSYIVVIGVLFGCVWVVFRYLDRDVERLATEMQRSEQADRFALRLHSALLLAHSQTRETKETKEIVARVIRDIEDMEQKATHALNISNEPFEWDFFISYAKDDRSWAESLYAALSTNHRVFCDVYEVRHSDDWSSTIGRALASTRLIIILISANSEAAYYQRDEISTAIQLARKDAKQRRIIPVFLDGFSRDVTAVPYGLGSFQGLDALELGMEGIAVELRKAAARQDAGSEQVDQQVRSTTAETASSKPHETAKSANEKTKIVEVVGKRRTRS